LKKAQKQIHFMMEQLDLVDFFRELNPDIKRYTWRGPAKKLPKQLVINTELNIKHVLIIFCFVLTNYLGYTIFYNFNIFFILQETIIENGT
jgi:hypothetical protein